MWKGSVDDFDVCSVLTIWLDTVLPSPYTLYQEERSPWYVSSFSFHRLASTEWYKHFSIKNWAKTKNLTSYQPVQRSSEVSIRWGYLVIKNISFYEPGFETDLPDRPMLRTNDLKSVCHRTWWVALTRLGSIDYLTCGWALPCSLSALPMHVTGKCLGRRASRSESDIPTRLGLLRLPCAVPHPHPLDALSHSVSQCGWSIQKNFEYAELA